MQKSKFDHSVFYRNSRADIILLVVYVNGVVITRSGMTGIYHHLNPSWPIPHKGLRDAKVFLWC